MTNEELQKMLNEIPEKKFAKLSDSRLEYIEISKHKIFSEETRKKLSNKIITEETRKKLSEINKNKKHSAVTKKKISEKKRGIILSDETKRKMSEAKIGKKNSEEHNKKISQREITKETRKKMSENKKGIKFSDEHKKRISEKKMKPIIMCSYPKMDFIQEFNSIDEATINLKLNRNYICKRLLGMIKNPGDFTFKYKNNNSPTID